MRFLYVWKNLLVILIVALTAVSCTTNGGMESHSGLKVSEFADGIVESDIYMAKKGGLVLAGYTKIVPIEGVDSHYKLKISDKGADGKWMTADDGVSLCFRENFAADGRLLSVETYTDPYGRIIERLENVGFDSMGNPVERVFTKDGERFQQALEYNSEGYCTKITRYDGINLLVGTTKYIWTTYWNDDVFITKRYGVTSHGTATPDFIALSYTGSDREKLLSVELYAEEGTIVESYVTRDGFPDPITLSAIEAGL